MKGRIHSLETCGTVDGPGIRFVIFMQGCPMRCRYCHNPDTWDVKGGSEVTVEELVEEINRYLPYMEASGGGVTVSGGEPLLQSSFVTELFTRLKGMGIHTALDTSGFCNHPDPKKDRDLERLLTVTDLVLLDLKIIDPAKHHWLTSQYNERILSFARLLAARHIPVWIRHVLVPGVTDDPEDVRKMARFLHCLQNVEKLEVLPYHRLGIHKWEALQIPYSLKEILPPKEEEVESVTAELNRAIFHPAKSGDLLASFPF